MKLLFSLYIQHIRTLQRSVIREMSVLTHTHARVCAAQSLAE